MPTKPATHKPRRSNTPVYIAPERKHSGTRLVHTNRWRTAAKTYLTRNPLCVECKRSGITKPATDVDHIIPHKGDMNRFWDSDNWQPLCHSCHSIKTAKEDGGFGNRYRGGSNL